MQDTNLNTPGTTSLDSVRERVGVIPRDDQLARQGFEILHWGFVALPTIAGLDKFTNLLTRWTSYLAPQLAALSPLRAPVTMKIVGVIEIGAALIVALRPG